MRSLIALVLLTVTSSAFAQAICSFETGDFSAIISPSVVRVERVQEHATEGQWALKALFPGNERDSWPGLTIRAFPDPASYDTLILDVFNPGEAPVALSLRIDSVSGAAQFASKTIPAKSAQSMEFGIKGLGAIKQFFAYVRCPREDVTLFFDNFRFERFATRFSPLVFVDDAPAPQPNTAETRQGMILFRRPFSDPVFESTKPLPEDRLQSVDMFATPGEYEPATFAIYALANLKAVRVTLEGLPAEGEVYPVRCLDKRVTYSSKDYVKSMPVLCERRQAVDIAASSSKSFVLDLRIRDDAAPGIHQGTIRIARDGADTFSIPLRLRVLPFRLAEPPGMYWGEYYVRPRYAASDAEFLALLPIHLADMRAHGMTSVGFCIGPPTEKTEFAADGACALNLPGDSVYERFMDLYRDLKFPAPVVLLSDSGQGAATKGSAKPLESPEWAACYQAYWKAMQAEHRRRGWPEVIVQPVDEPGWQGPEEKERNVRCLKLLKQIPGLRTEQDGPGDSYFHNEAGPVSDLWNYNGALSTPDVVSKAQAEGRTVLLYNCDVESYRPEVDRYTAGWFQVRSGASGCFNWAYVTYGGGPYDDQDNQHGDWMHIYPPVNGEPGGPSTGWIGAREGVDDYKYVAALRDSIRTALASNNAAAQQAARAGQQQLDSLLASLDYSPSVRQRAAWIRTGVAPDGTRTIGGTLKLPNGWEHADYGRARWKVARATWAILAAFRQAPQPTARLAPQPWDRPLLAGIRWTTTQPVSKPAVSSGSHHVTIPMLTNAPTLDGDISEAVWQHAARLDPFTLMSGAAAPQQQTEVFLAADGKNLYVAATCHEDNMAHLTARVTKDGGPVWQDDCLEIFVDGALSRARYHQIGVNPLGVQCWNSTDTARWQPRSIAHSKQGTGAWTVELAIPLASLKLTGSEFGLNVCRARRPMETLELSSWSPTGTGFGVPDRFGVANLGQAWIQALSVPPARLGTNEFSAIFRNETAQPQTVRVYLAAGGAPAHVLEQAFAIPAGKEVRRTYSFDLRSETAPQFTLSVQNAAGKPFAKRDFTPTVLPALRLLARPHTCYLSESSGALDLTVHLASNLRAAARLTLSLAREGQPAPLRTLTLPRIEGDSFSALLDLSGLPEGAYTLQAALTTTAGAPIASASARLQRLSGPFD